MSDRSADARQGGRYVGRFAPSPTGPLHAGSLVAALASWLDARAHDGRWLLRIEDLDHPRCVPGASDEILRQLAACGLASDAAPEFQSARVRLYEQALQRLVEAGWAYPCACSRREIDEALAMAGRTPPRHGERIYPGTCRNGLRGRSARALRMRATAAPDSLESACIEWQDRRLGAHRQDLGREVGDFVLRRADGIWAYQLAVVVDDAEQGITDIVRGEDLADNTPRQIHLQRALGLPTPRYLHTPLVLGPDGEKLSKQNGAAAIDRTAPLRALRQAAAVLGLAPASSTLSEWLAEAIAQWRAHWLA